MASSFPLDFFNFELEITNRCNLACPRCSRTDLISLYPKHWKDADLDLDDFKRFIAPVLDQINIFEFKGTLGDPIFHPYFLDWIYWCKQAGKRVKIHTNGQAGARLWQRLFEFLDHDDSVILGIDGMPDDFMKYRVNARWSNIEGCAEALAGHVDLRWQYIVFSYNQHEIEQARLLSLEMGFSGFDVIHSNRWLAGDDWLKPTGDSLPRNTIDRGVDPACLNKPMHIVSADGYYMPCCYLIDDRWRYKSPWAKAFKIQDCDIDDVIRSSMSSEFFAKLNDESAPEYCRFQCGKCDGK